MKRSDAKRKLTNFLKNWEGSKLSDGKCAKELLVFIENELGMLPPHAVITGSKDEQECHIQNCQWEPEE